MVNHGCNNGTLEGTDYYASPVPWIGLYIAAASSVCTLLMIYDFTVGYRSRKLWIPCKLFQLNSVTLTLMSVVVKLQVDLTTPMPRGIDQLSKLSGTSFLCIYMFYIMPSLGVMKDWSNMYALSILVVTVLVNMCIQMSTGVIVLFMPEHIITLSIMVLQLYELWFCAWVAKARKVTSIAKYKSYFIEGNHNESFIQRLKVTYLYSFSSNPQFLASRSSICSSSQIMSLPCSIILIQASVRSVILKKVQLCQELSDYGWSMGIIVVTQIISVVVGTLVVFYRRRVMESRLEKDELNTNPIEEPYSINRIWRFQNIFYEMADFLNRFVHIPLNRASETLAALARFAFPASVRSALRLEDDIADSLNCHMLILLNRALERLPCAASVRSALRLEDGIRDKTSIQGFEHLMQTGDMGFSEWTLTTSVQSMKRMIERSKRQKHDQHNPLSTILLSPKAHCSKSLSVRQRSTGDHIIPLGLLHLVLLVKIAEVSLPSDKVENIILAFREVFEVLYFIQKHVNSTSFKAFKETEVAKVVWKATGFERFLPASVEKYINSSLALEHAKRIITELPNALPHDMIYMEMCNLTEHLNNQSVSTINDLYYCIEDLFVESLENMLPQLPEAIFRAVCGSPVEEFQERVGLGLKYLCKFESWEGITWEPPRGYKCLSLLDNVTNGIQNDAPGKYPAPDECTSVDEIVEIGGSNLMANSGDVTIPVEVAR